MTVFTLTLAALLVGQLMTPIDRVLAPDCSDSSLADVIECVYREFIEDDSRRGPAEYYLGCVWDTAGGLSGSFSDPSPEYLSRFGDTGVPVFPYSAWSPDSLSGDPPGLSGSSSGGRRVRCGVLKLNWYPASEGLAIMQVEGAVPDTTLFAVGLIKDVDGKWVAGVF